MVAGFLFKGTDMSESTKGVWAVIAACTIWGISSVFYKMLSHVPAIEVLAHRTVWSVVFFTIVLVIQKRFMALREVFGSLSRIGIVGLASIMIAFNWFCFIYAIQIGHATEASFGYFIFPLVAVCLGVVFFGERLSLGQKLAIALAAVAVLTLGLGQGVVPWVPLALSLSFGAYSALKERLEMGPVVSVTGGVILLLPIALGLMLYFGATGTSGVQGDIWTIGLLIVSGPLTAIPLILFSYGARRLTMSTVGIVQYINPTLQFLVAVLILGEPFGAAHMIAFAFIWLALAVYSSSAYTQDRARRRAVMVSEAEVVVSTKSSSDASAKP